MVSTHHSSDAPASDSATKPPRVHVAIGPVCNNNCLFCMEEDRRGRREINAALTPEHVRNVLVHHRGAEEVCFTSGEPTLVAGLPTYVAWARELGYSRVSLSTNGRRLAYKPYCAALVRAGLNLLYISIHGHSAKIHDGLTRTPGAFAQTMAGLQNVVALKNNALRVHTCTVVTKRNVLHFWEIFTRLRDEGADQVVFNVPQPNGRADTHFDRVVVRYEEVAVQFERFLERLEQGRPPVFLVDIPACVTERIPDFHRGWVERYVHHEATSALSQEPLTSRPTTVPGLVERRRSDYDHAWRWKRLECARCARDEACPGVWSVYVKRFGWDEFQPIEQHHGR
ncbi:radical SAM protein [Myxococcota bacterium]